MLVSKNAHKEIPDQVPVVKNQKRVNRQQKNQNDSRSGSHERTAEHARTCRLHIRRSTFNRLLLFFFTDVEILPYPLLNRIDVPVEVTPDLWQVLQKLSKLYR